MSFEWPLALIGLVLVPLALAAYLVHQRRRKRYAVRFTNLDLLASVVQGSPGWRRHVPALLALLALTALVAAVARPQREVDVPRERATVVLTTDSSGSMKATDVDPTRLDAGRSAAKSFADRLPDGFRLGLVSFSQSASVLVSPTTDREQVERALDGLTAKGGTAMGDALERSLESVRPPGEEETPEDEREPAVLLLISDGASTTGVDPLDVADEAERLGVPIHTVALGTAAGEVTVPDSTGIQRRVSVPPDTATLRDIADTTGGRYFEAPDEEELAAVYEDVGRIIGYDQEEREITAAFAAGGLVMMLAGWALSLLWFGRLP